MTLIRDSENKEALEKKLTEDPLAALLVEKIMEVERQTEQMLDEYEQFFNNVKDIRSRKPTANVRKTRKVPKDKRKLHGNASKYEEEIVAEKEKFEALSDNDKLEYLSQAFRAQQLFDAKVYDIASKNQPKIK